MLTNWRAMTHFPKKIWNIWCRSYYCGWDFVKYYLKHQEVVYRAPKMPIILGKSRISADFGAVYVGPPIRIGADLGFAAKVSENDSFSRKIWNIWCRSYYCGWDFVKYYLKHQEVVYRAPKCRLFWVNREFPPISALSM